MTDDDPDVDAGVLAPDEVDIGDNDHVVPLENDRYLVSPTMIDDHTADRIKSLAEADADEDTDADAPAGDVETVRTAVAESLAETDARYAFEAFLVVDDEVVRHRTVTNDVTVGFDRLVNWYASEVGGDTPVEDALRILLRESALRTTLTAQDVADIVADRGLDPDDSIADLLEALRSEGTR